MPYLAEISTGNPSCFVFLIDQSLSMAEVIEGRTEETKAEGLANAINKLLQNLVLKCTKSSGIKDYYHVCVIGYGENVAPALAGPFAERTFVPISEIGNQPAKLKETVRIVQDDRGNKREHKTRQPVWLEPKAEGETPMCEALFTAGRLLKQWLSRYPACFPPIVINISDGASTDGNPLEQAYDLMMLSSKDGEILLFNMHIGSSGTMQVQFPDTDAQLPNEHARLLFNMSSPLPEYMVRMLHVEGTPLSRGAKGFVYNADMLSVIRFLDIGTKPGTGLR
jgi:hypothetical protein